MEKHLLLFIFLVLKLGVFCQWNNNITVNNTISNQSGSQILNVAVSDGSNGSIVFFEDDLNGKYYAQKITSTGVVTWGNTFNPVDICATTSDKTDFNVIPDGNGGAFVAWADYRNNSKISDIYIQKINNLGIVQWGANGLRVTNTVELIDNKLPFMCSDGAGGIIVAWTWNNQTNKNIQVFAQRFNGSGTAQWEANGIQICTAVGFKYGGRIVQDGNNGAVIFFIDSRNDPIGLIYKSVQDFGLTNSDVYAQRLNSSGLRLWTDNGVAVCTASGNQNYDNLGKAIPDGSGGAIFVFNDLRNDNGSGTNYDIFAQRLNSSGTRLWALNGVPACPAFGSQYLSDAVSDGFGGIILSILYLDSNRNYAQRINPSGNNLWTNNGLPVTKVNELVAFASIVNDGSGNTIFTYGSITADGSSLLKAQKLSNSGEIQWGTDGVIVSNATVGNYYFPIGIVKSNNGSTIISWHDGRNSFIGTPMTGIDIFASKLLSNGILDGNGSSVFITATNGDWNNNSTWIGGIVPPSGASVIIKHNVRCNINTSCSSLIVEQPGGVTVVTGFKISIGY